MPSPAASDEKGLAIPLLADYSCPSVVSKVPVGKFEPPTLPASIKEPPTLPGIVLSSPESSHSPSPLLDESSSRTRLLHSLGHTLMTAWQRRRREENASMDLVPNSSLHEGLEDFFDATDSQLLRLWTQTHDRGAYSSMQVLIGFFSLSEKDWKDDAPLRAALNALGEAAHEDASSRGDLSFSEFLACAHVVKMCALLALSGDGSGVLSVCDYSPSRCELVPNLAVELRRDWLQHRRPSWSRNRWVHLTQAGHELHATRQTLKLVASKYGLHPLAIEDALEERHRAKCSRYEGHIFVLFPAIDIDRRAYQSDSHTLRLGKQSSDKRVSLQMRLVAIFLTAPHLNTLVSYATDDRDACGRVPPGFQQSELSRQDALHIAVTKARRRLQRNYSILRSAPASLLLHRLLDGLVDAIGPAADALEHVVEELLEQVRRLPLVASEGVPSPEMPLVASEGVPSPEMPLVASEGVPSP